jgi:hypothetical protein
LEEDSFGGKQEENCRRQLGKSFDGFGATGSSVVRAILVEHL